MQIALLERRSDDFKQHHKMWEQLEILMEAGQRLKDNAGMFLEQKPKEHGDVYAARCAMFTYQDILGNCMGWFGGKLFRREARISFEEENSDITAFIQDCNRAGDDLLKFYRKVWQDTSIYGWVAVLIDRPAEKPAANRLEEKQRGLDRPYLSTWNPNWVVNFQRDQYGELDWVILKSITKTQGDPLGTPEIATNWYVFDRKTFQHFQYVWTDKEIEESVASDGILREIKYQPNAEAVLVSGPAPHVLSSQNRVPVCICELPDILWLGKRAYLHLREHINVQNGYAWKLFLCNLATLVIRSESDINSVTLSEETFLHLRGPNDEANYLEPDAATFEESRKRLAELIEECYRDFYLQAMARKTTATAHAQSGISKQEDMAPSVDVLNDFGDLIRKWIQDILADVATIMQVQMEEPNVEGFQFETKPALEDIEVGQALKEFGILDMSDTLQKEALKRVALTYLHDANRDLQEKVIQEIEAAPTFKEQRDAEMQAQQDAFNKSLDNATAKNTLATEAA